MSESLTVGGWRLGADPVVDDSRGPGPAGAAGHRAAEAALSARRARATNALRGGRSRSVARIRACEDPASAARGRDGRQGPRWARMGRIPSCDPAVDPPPQAGGPVRPRRGAHRSLDRRRHRRRVSQRHHRGLDLRAHRRLCRVPCSRVSPGSESSGSSPSLSSRSCARSRAFSAGICPATCKTRSSSARGTSASNSRSSYSTTGNTGSSSSGSSTIAPRSSTTSSPLDCRSCSAVPRAFASASRRTAWSA